MNLMKTLSFLLLACSLLLASAISSADGLSIGLPRENSVNTDKSSDIKAENQVGANRQFVVEDTFETEDPRRSGSDSLDERSNPDRQGPGLPLFTFRGMEPSWYTVNDNVMGGISSSTVVVDTNQQNLSFSGEVSLDNNGGFASTRSEWTSYDLSAFDGIALRVRGDGNAYRFRIRTEATGFGIAYTGLFQTKAGTWQDIYLPFSEMVPLYRGFVVNAAGPLDPESIRSFGLMVSDKQQGEFSLEVDWINAVAEQKNEIRYASSDADNKQFAGNGRA